MTVIVRAEGVIALEGTCPVEDAEPLRAYLAAHAGTVVDWRSCETAHTAVIQVLLAARPVLRGPPAGKFFRIHLQPLLQSAN